MAVAGISSLGITFGYGVETTAGTKPASFKKLTRINTIVWRYSRSLGTSSFALMG